ncbi:helix-turn-helix domain-containing protein, partial [Bradyrhizobium sp. GCM10027634]|uniref:helix-turn-helix domain-containing protein n=1 Tax=unclassified Bradyrhizobium TaxID=2631580 RepID=UPI00263AD679
TQDELIESASEPSWFVVLAPGKGSRSIRDIQKAVCERYRVTLADMLSPRRSDCIAFPRQVAYYLCKELTLATLPQIGRRFGGRDHSSVHHGVAKIARRLQTDEALAKTVGELREQLQ